jgi:hypothetical protein
MTSGNETRGRSGINTQAINQKALMTTSSAKLILPVMIKKVRATLPIIRENS